MALGGELQRNIGNHWNDYCGDGDGDGDDDCVLASVLALAIITITLTMLHPFDKRKMVRAKLPQPLSPTKAILRVVGLWWGNPLGLWHS